MTLIIRYVNSAKIVGSRDGVNDRKDGCEKGFEKTKNALTYEWINLHFLEKNLWRSFTTHDRLELDLQSVDYDSSVQYFKSSQMGEWINAKILA